MNKYIVGLGQSIFDLAIQLTGSVEGLTDLLVANGEDLNWVPDAGEEIINPDVVYDQEMLDYLAAEGVTIITGTFLNEGAFTDDFNYDYNI